MLGVLGDLTVESLNKAASTEAKRGDPSSKPLMKTLEPNEEPPTEKGKSAKLPAENSPTARSATHEKTPDQSSSKIPQQAVDCTTFKLPHATKKDVTRRPLEAVTAPPNVNLKPCSNSATGKEDKMEVQPGDVKLAPLACEGH